MTPARVFAACLAAVGSFASASTTLAGSWSIGLRGGPGITSFHGDFTEISHPEYQLGILVGGGVDYSLMPSFALAVEALYASKGASFSGEATDEQGRPMRIEAHLRLRYLEVPLLARISFLPSATFRPYLIGGPTAGFALGATYELDGFPDRDFSDDLQSPDFGVIGGVGVRTAGQPISYGIEARYSNNFADVWNLDDNLESKNHGFSVTVSVARVFGVPARERDLAWAGSNLAP